MKTKTNRVRVKAKIDTKAKADAPKVARIRVTEGSTVRFVDDLRAMGHAVKFEPGDWMTVTFAPSADEIELGKLRREVNTCEVQLREAAADRERLAALEGELAAFRSFSVTVGVDFSRAAPPTMKVLHDARPMIDRDGSHFIENLSAEEKDLLEAFREAKQARRHAAEVDAVLREKLGLRSTFMPFASRAYETAMRALGSAVVGAGVNGDDGATAPR